MLKTFKNNYHRITYFLLYISLIVGFIFNENVTNGPYKDLQYTLKQVEIFSNEFGLLLSIMTKLNIQIGYLQFI